MQLDKKKLIAGGAVVIASVIGWASAMWFGVDNPIEETMEAVVKHETGLDVDLTPSSKE